MQERLRDRWCTDGLMRCRNIPVLATNILQNLRWLAAHVPPRVHTACIRLAFNGWHTSRRYQERGSCIYCRVEGTWDSIEHYFRCRTVHDILPSRLKHRSGIVPIRSWFLCCTLKQDKLLMALYIYAIYKLGNIYRHTHCRHEMKQAVERLVLEVPLRASLKSFVQGVLQHHP